MQFFVGTSGYSFSEWKGHFYPEKLPQKQMLRYYAERFSTVEINNTFHKFPSASVVTGWADQVPESFRFVLKARQSITHFRRLQNAQSQIDDFLNLASLLGERQGPILFQLPPNFKQDVPRLEGFLKYVGGRAKLALEFRHESWFDDATFACLRNHSAALCVADAEGLPTPELVRTATWGYVRLREEGYTDKNLRKWVQRINSADWDDIFVFFKHEDAGAGPRMATRFLELVGD